MFKKLVAIEPVNLLPNAKQRLSDYAHEVLLYDDIPRDDAEILERIGDADALLVSYTTQIRGEVISRASELKYIGMCCSLYDEHSASVDIASARECGVVVTGVRDYGDEGVAEFVVSELVQLLHGTAQRKWCENPREIGGLKVGIVGLGVTGMIIARALRFFGADVSYYSRTRKSDAEHEGLEYRELNDLLSESEVVCCCLTKNIVLLHEEQFKALGSHKILINTAGGVPYDMECLERFVEGDNFLICDMQGALPDDKLHHHPNVRYIGSASGVTEQAMQRLSDKVLLNIEQYLER